MVLPLAHSHAQLSCLSWAFQGWFGKAGLRSPAVVVWVVQDMNGYSRCSISQGLHCSLHC